MLTVVVDSCVFVNNTASSDGGALYVSFCDAWVLNCTFHQNSATAGTGTIALSTAGIGLDHTIVSSSNGYGIIAWYSLLTSSFSCNDFYGNAGGNYGGLISDQTGTNNNISADPQYCNPPSDLAISTTSPCTAAYSPCGQQIGRFGAGCGPNLVFASVVWTSTTPQPGTSITGAVKVKNTGTKSTGSFYIDYYKDRATTPPEGLPGDERHSVASLAAGDSVSWTTSPVTSAVFTEWQSYFRVDTDAQVPETNESDNLSGPHTIVWQVPNESGWPVSTGASFHSSPVIGAINDDLETLEIAIGCDNGNLYAWRPDGTNVPGFPVTLPDSIVSSPALGDVIGNYRNEIVVGCNNGVLYAFGGHGEAVWQYSTKDPIKTTPSLADLDGDGKLETICASGDAIYVITGDGLDFKGWPFTVEGATFAGTAVGDGDGVPEIAAVARTGASVSKVYLLKANGKPYEGAWPVQLDAVVTAGPAIGDITTAHGLETVVGATNGMMYVITTAGVVWTPVPQVTGSITSSPIIEDVDGDTHLDIVVSSTNYELGGHPPAMRWVGYVTAIDRTGTIMLGWPQTAGYWLTDVGPIQAAVALGSYRDVMVGSPHNLFYSWYGSGTGTPSFPLNLGANVITSAAAGDVDGDGWIEILVATSGGAVQCRELRSTYYTEANLWWPMLGHGRLRTHCYGFVVPTAVDENPGTTPAATAIASIYPNPFNPTTTIVFDLAAKGPVELAIYDVSGRTMAVLVDRVLEAGRHETSWNGLMPGGGVAPSGVYFCRLSTGTNTISRKMVLLG